MSNFDRGYLYVASGDQRFLREALQSVQTLRRHEPNASVTLVSDLAVDDLRPVAEHAFDSIVHVGRESAAEDRPSLRKRGLQAKVRHIYQSSPYQRTFFVDTDTHFLRPCSELFRLLEHFDLCLAHAPADVTQPQGAAADLKGYTPYNSGVILFRKNERTHRLFAKWWELYRTAYRAGLGDQPILMRALTECDRSVSTYVLQPTMNFRVPFNERLVGPVRIMHGRPNEPGRVAKEVNRTEENRVWLAEPEVVVPVRMSLAEQLRLFRKLFAHFFRMLRYRIQRVLPPRRNS